ncbi:MAG TPA: amidase family protein [Myxococcales bacterium]|jgi:amidase|nr:amidase family protein [Myxococcales bacterium]
MHKAFLPAAFASLLSLGTLLSCSHAQPRAGGPVRIEEATIQELQEAMRSGALTSHALTQHYLDRIARFDKEGPKLNAFLLVNPRALEEADQLDAERAKTGPRGLLHGIPVVLKDNMNTKDLPTTGGSVAFVGAQPQSDAFIVAKLRAAGVVILGKGNLHELARAGTTVSSLGGQTLNPYDLTRTPGGSSGGPAAAVAANMAESALGSDTVNSIRSPASACDLVGLRPTIGLVSRSGIIPAALTQDMAGPITRTVSDAAILLAAIQGEDPKDPTTKEGAGKGKESYLPDLDKAGLRGARIGVLRSFFGAKPEHAEVNRVVGAAIDRMKELGAEPVELAVPLDVDALISDLDVQKFESKTQIDAWLRDLGPGAPAIHTFDAWVQSGKFDKTLEKGLKAAQPYDHPEQDPEYLRRIGPGREALQKQVAALFADQKLDAIVYPHQKRLVVPIGESQTDRNGFLASITGYPAIAVPAGFSSGGVPIGLELLGKPFAESTILKLAYGYEQGTQNRRPPASAP